LKIKTMATPTYETDETMQKLVQELEIHKIELEMQNAELCQTRDETAKVLESYTDLYDFAPVGYVTLTRETGIIGINLRGAGLLNAERERLIGRRFEQFISGDSRPDFNDFINTIFTSPDKASCEVTLTYKEHLPVVVQIEGMAITSKAECHLALIDITGRKQGKVALQESEQRLYKLAEMAVDAILMMDDSGVVTTCNAATEKMFGCPSSEIIGQDFHLLFTPERFGNVQKQGRTSFKESGAGPLVGKWSEVIGLRKDGTEFPLDLSVSALNIKGKWHAIGIMRDVTEHRQVAEALKKSEQKFTKIFHSVPALISISTLKEGRFIDINQTFLHTLGYQRDEIIGRTSHELDLWEDGTDRATLVRMMEEQASVQNLEVTLKRKNGDLLLALLSAELIDIDNEQYLLTIARDITERKQLEIKIQEALEYAENIVETVREPLVVLDSELKILTANHSFYETFKVNPTDTIGHFIYDLGNRQWDIPKLRVLFEDILPNDTVFNGYEVEHEFPDIGRKTILLNARHIFREKIGSHIILLAMEDITERKQLETEIQAAREYAENIVETVREPLMVLDSDLKILTANHSFYETFKVTPEATIGNFIYDIGNRQWDIPKLRILFEDILPLSTVFNGYEVEHDFVGIGRKIIRLNAREVYRKDIRSRVILLAMEDITVRKLAEERIGEVIRQQQAILDNIPNSAWLKDKDGRYLAVNEPFGKLFGVAPKDLVGKNDYDIYPRERAVKYEKNSREVMSTGTRTYFEETIVDREGNVQYVEKIKTPIFNDAGAVIGIIGIAHDITSRKEIEVSLRHDSTHDILTGLYNRAFFDEELERLSHGRLFPISIVMADVNGLKCVNDTMGHDAGDNLIRLAARIILDAFRAEDIVARIGGDEFAVLLPFTDAVVAEEAVERIKSSPEATSGQVSIAFGVASADSKDQLTEALKLSDERMYRHKSVQKG